ncbi:tetraspanin-1 [Clonorchis sinensis]|nr:tetraspanin-1 [Clonorchis sinensis]
MGMFVIGLFIIGIYLLGVLAGATFNRNLIIIFSVINGLLIIIHITIIVVYLADSTLLTQQGELMLKDSVQRYVSITSDDANSQRLAYLMRRLECCGFKNGEDFANSALFQRNTKWQGTNYTLLYPIPCCKFVFYNQPQGNCPSVFNPQNSNIANGCWEALMKIAVGVLWASIILLVLMISLECVTISMLVMTKDW